MGPTGGSTGSRSTDDDPLYGEEAEGLLEIEEPTEKYDAGVSSPVSGGKSSSLYDTNVIGIILLLFAVYGLRFVYLPQMWHGEGLQVFYPVVSPVYRQGEHWQGFKKQISIISHVVFGAVMLTTGVLQFDKKLRNQYTALHRWSGRIYILCGSICVFALYGLSDSFGAGSSHLPGSRSELLAVFVHICAVLWVCTTGVALYAVVVDKNYALHRDAMSASIAVGAIPILQRLASVFMLTPVSMMLRCWLCTARDTMPWQTRWGRPGSDLSLLFGPCDACGADANKIADSEGIVDPRACPEVFTLDGYGEGELASFPVSAWVGLIVVTCAVGPQILRHVRGGQYTASPEHIAYANKVSATNSFDLLRLLLVKLERYSSEWAVYLESLLYGRCKESAGDQHAPTNAYKIIQKFIIGLMAVIAPVHALLTAAFLSFALYYTTVGAIFLVSIFASPILLLAIIFNFSLLG